MLGGEIISIGSETRTEHMKSLFLGQNVQLLNVKIRGAYSYH